MTPMTPSTKDIVHRAVIGLAFSIIIWWTFDLEQKCKCSDSWKRDYIRYGFSLALLLVTASAFVRIPFQTVHVLVSIMLVSLYCVIISYIGDLRRIKCGCSEGWKQQFSFAWPVVSIGLSVAAMLYAALNWDVQAFWPSPGARSRPRLPAAGKGKRGQTSRSGLKQSARS